MYSKLNGLWKSPNGEYEVALRDNKVLWQDNNMDTFEIVQRENKIILTTQHKDEQGEFLIGHISNDWGEIKWTDGDYWEKTKHVRDPFQYEV